ncbi:hypothetical protein [Spiroplasma endosymbiont of Othius punctulatus]|uniref:hypothetical protein n=1 Tax=Spiroplasma endosymbiont of Othius punctulatus TaxID=3066289 RepID=UPI0030CD6E54
MNLAENNFNSFKILKDSYGIKKLSELLSVNIGTIKRWEKLNSIPTQYTFDLKKMINLISDSNEDIDIIKINYKKLHNNQKMLDQFYTTDKLAKECFKILKFELKKIEIDIEDFKIIEPSAGAGNIFKLLDKDKRIGIELTEGIDDEYKIIDFLDYAPELDGDYIVFGNPPFGLRGNMALRFINHASKFADVVAFILPPLFNSDGKGTPKNRVKGLELLYSKELPLQLFEYPDGTKVKLNVCFQIWTKKNCELIPVTVKRSVSDYVEIFSISDGINSSDQRNVKMINKCDFYLPSTTFNDIKLLDYFSETEYKRGYGIKILKDKEKISNILINTNWNDVSMKSVNFSKNVRKSIIEKVLIENKIFNDID